jgi:hypothetical protein
MSEFISVVLSTIYNKQQNNYLSLKDRGLEDSQFFPSKEKF